MAAAAGSPYPRMVRSLRTIIEQTRALAPNIRLIFVTNIRPDDHTLRDLGPDGVDNLAQYYLQRDADEIIRALQDLGVTVEPHFSEQGFVRAMLAPQDRADQRIQVVYTTAEGGTGPGRRALIPALCNLMGVPILNSGPHAATMARHKFHAFCVLQRVGVRMPETWQFAEGCWTGGLRPPHGTRVIVKPSYESMAIGVDANSVRVIDSQFDEYVADRHNAFAQPAIVQEFISGEEVGVPVCRVERTWALPPIAQRRANGESYDGHPKTFADEHVRHDLSHVGFQAPESQILALRAAAELAFDALEMRGVGRIDFRVDADGRAWAFDMNGEPPPVSRTCWSESLNALGLRYEDMLAAWLGMCLNEYGLISGV